MAVVPDVVEARVEISVDLHGSEKYAAERMPKHFASKQ